MHRVNQIVKQIEENNQEETKETSVQECATSASLKYTVDGFADRLFTKEQREFYEENGYIVVRNLLNNQDVKVLNDHFDNLSKNPAIRDPNMVLMRDVSLLSDKSHDKKAAMKTSVITKLQYWALDDVFYKNYLAKDKILKYLECFIGENIASIHHMYINKPTDPGTLTSRHPLHQDYTFFPLSNPDRIVACWTALQDITRENGGLCVIPKSHKLGMFKHNYPEWEGGVNKMYYAVSNQVYKKYESERIHLNMKSGDAVFFHPFLIHGSSANLSEKTRRSMCVHFASTTECKFMDDFPKGCDYVPDDYVKTVTHIFKTKWGGKPNIVDVWRLKGRVVQGEQGNWKMPQSYWQEWDKHYYVGGRRPAYTKQE